MRILTGLLLLCISMFLAAGGLILVQRMVPIGCVGNTTTWPALSTRCSGYRYAVLLGLTVVAVWEEWNRAVVTADEEASSLAEVFWIADSMPESEGHHIQELARSYARLVVNEEWQLMEQGKSSPKAWDLIDDIRASLQNFDTSTPEEQVLYEQGFERMRDLAGARRDRLLEAEQGLPVVLWIVLIAGGMIVIGFTYLFGLESTVVHLLMVASLALIIALVLFTVAALNYPFKGDITVGLTPWNRSSAGSKAAS